MHNASSKLLITVALCLGGCSTANPDRDAAEELLSQAQTALDRGDFMMSAQLLDSLSAIYPHQVETGRKALALRPKVMERKTEQEIVELQLQLQAAKAYADSLEQYFTLTPRSDDVLEPFFQHNDVPANWRETNTAVARVSPGGDFTVISSLDGRSTRHTSIALEGDGVTVTSGAVAFDPEALLSRESVRFAAGNADTLGVFAVQMDGKPLTLKYIGMKTATAKMSAKQVHAIADSWRLSQALSLIGPGEMRLVQLKQKLQVSRDQQARLTEE